MENQMLRAEATQAEERTPLTFQLAESLSAINPVAGATARNSGGTTGGGGYTEDANIDYD